MGVNSSEKKRLDKLAKTLKPQPKSRFLPGQVPTHVDKEDLKLYTEHRVNVTYANPKIDNKPPKFALDLYYNEKKLLEIAKHVKTLDNENMKLLEKLNIVHRSKPKVECWNNLVALYKDKIKEKIENNKNILYFNKEIMLKIKKATSDYSRTNLMMDWKKNKAILQRLQKYPSPLTYSDGTQSSIIKEPLESEDSTIRIKCFFEIQFAQTKQNLGRIVFELYSDYVPRTCANFEAFCRGTNGLSYKGTEFFRIIPGYWCQGGDVEKFNGTGGTSIYGDTFEDENFNLIHADRGVISMWSNGKNTNNSKFNITFGKLETMDGQCVVFGKIIRGLTNLEAIEEQGTKSGKVLHPIIISNCGVLKTKSDKSSKENRFRNQNF